MQTHPQDSHSAPVRDTQLSPGTHPHDSFPFTSNPVNATHSPRDITTQPPGTHNTATQLHSTIPQGRTAQSPSYPKTHSPRAAQCSKHTQHNTPSHVDAQTHTDTKRRGPDAFGTHRPSDWNGTTQPHRPANASPIPMLTVWEHWSTQTHPSSADATDASGPDTGTLKCNHRRSRAWDARHRDLVIPPTPPPPAETPRAPQQGRGRPGGGPQAAQGQARGLPRRGAEHCRPLGSKFKAPGGGRGALSAPLRSGHFPLAGAPRSPRPGYPRRPPRPPPHPAPPGVHSGFPLPRGLRARGSCAPGRAHPSPAPPKRGRGPGLVGGTLSRSPALPANSAAPTRGPPLGDPAAPRPPTPPPAAGRGHRRTGVLMWRAWGGCPRIESLPQTVPPDLATFAGSPRTTPKTPRAKTKVGAATYHGAAARRRGRRRSERARSPARGGRRRREEAAREGARGRERAREGGGAPAPAPPVRRTLPSARLPRPRSPPAPQAAGRPGPGCRSSIPGPARSRGGQESGGGDGSWVPGRARGLLSGSTFAAARARSHTHARRRLGTLAARASSAPTQSPRTPTRTGSCSVLQTHIACGCHPDTQGPTRTADRVSWTHTSCRMPSTQTACGCHPDRHGDPYAHNLRGVT